MTLRLNNSVIEASLRRQMSEDRRQRQRCALPNPSFTQTHCLPPPAANTQEPKTDQDILSSVFRPLSSEGGTQALNRKAIEAQRSDCLYAYGFRVYFTPLSGVLFAFPSRYWFTIGQSGVFSLGGWAPRLQSGYHVSRPTCRKLSTTTRFSCTGLSPSIAGLSRPFH